MPRQGRFTTLVGVATIMGMVFSGVAVALYAVDNKWIKGTPEMRVAFDDAVARVKDQSRLVLGFGDSAKDSSVKDLKTTRDGLAALEAGDTAPAVTTRPTATKAGAKPKRAKSRTATRNRKARTKPRRRVVRNKTRSKRRTVSVFAAAKDIPYPSKD